VELEVPALSRPARLETVAGPIKLVLTPQNLTHVPKIRCLLEFYLQHKKFVSEGKIPDTEMQSEHEAEDEIMSQEHERQSVTTPSPEVDSSSTTRPADDFTTPEPTADAVQVTSEALNSSISTRHEDTLRRSPANTPINEEGHEGLPIATQDLNDQQPPYLELAISSYPVLVVPDGSTASEIVKLKFTPSYLTIVCDDIDRWTMDYKDISVEVESSTFRIHGVVSQRANRSTDTYGETRLSVKATTSEAAQSITDSFYRHGASVEDAGLVSSNAKLKSPLNEDQPAVSVPVSVGPIPGPTSVLGCILDAKLEIDDVPMGDVNVYFDKNDVLLIEASVLILCTVQIHSIHLHWRLSWPHMHLQTMVATHIPIAPRRIRLDIELRQEDEAKAEAVRHYFENCVKSNGARGEEADEVAGMQSAFDTKFSDLPRKRTKGYGAASPLNAGSTS
jgi:hypothetical protein